MVDGSGISGVAKVKELEMDPLFGGVCVKPRVTEAVKGPPVTPPNVPGVQFPNAVRNSTPGVFVVSVIEVLAKAPKTALPKVRLVGIVVLNDTEPRDWVGMPAKTPV